MNTPPAPRPARDTFARRMRALTWLAAALVAGGAANAASLTVRDPSDGGRWQVIENPDDDQDNYILQRIGPDRKPDPRYGKVGSTEFQLGPDNDAPTSLRVEAKSRRAWTVGASLTGARPQAIVLRFGPDGNLDTRWGVLGRLETSPSGMSIRPRDVLPLDDGTVLVAGEDPNGNSTRAVVFHLRTDGAVDMNFGSGGVWVRPGAEQATAISLSVGGDGAAAVGVSIRGSKPQGEVWTLALGHPAKVATQVLEDGFDEDEARIDWAGDHWNWVPGGGATLPVESASLVPHVVATPAVAAQQGSSDPGNSAYNPFVETSRADAPVKVREDDGLPWIWIGVAGGLALALTGLFFRRPAAAGARARQDARR